MMAMKASSLVLTSALAKFLIFNFSFFICYSLNTRMASADALVQMRAFLSVSVYVCSNAHSCTLCHLEGMPDCELILGLANSIRYLIDYLYKAAFFLPMKMMAVKCRFIFVLI
jgi:hypothetical protein